MKITLFALNASFTHTNLAVRCLASELSKAGFEPYIQEYTLKDRKARVLYELAQTNSQIYAFSVYIWNRKEMLWYAGELKKIKPDIRIIFGGPEVSFENEDFLKEHPFIDTLILGEGESVITQICENPIKYRIVHGIPADDFITNGILYDRYPAKGDILYYESTRGCPYRCSYCLSSLSENIRAKSAEQTLDELLEFESLEPRPAIIKFIDRTFNYDISRAKKIWKGLISDRYTLNYHFEIAADLLDEECFEILANMPAGKIQFEAGIQSTNQNTLRAINRKPNSTTIINNLTRLRSTDNIHIHADLIAGLPYEDTASFKKSFDEAINCCHKLQLGFLKMLKGSSIRNDADMHEYIFDSDPPYKVYANKYISYKELYHIERIAATVDRFYSSGKFENTMSYVIPKLPSPFDFFSDLTALQTKDLEKTSQHECRLMLIAYLKDDKVALEKLALDTLIHENNPPPKELNGYYTEYTPDALAYSKEDLKNIKINNIKIYSFDFDEENYYLINRTKHIMKKRRIL